MSSSVGLEDVVRCTLYLCGITVLCHLNNKKHPLLTASFLPSPVYSIRSIVGCSAVTGNGLMIGVDWIVNDISQRIFLMA